jgi:hypothetical protein
MQKITYKTGRVYGSEQVLEIDVQENIEDDLGIYDIVATFVDSSRGISGRVETVVSNLADIGRAVLNAYDAGRYTTI